MCHIYIFKHMKKLLLVLGVIFLAATVQAADNWIKVGNLWYWYNDAKTKANVVTPQVVPAQVEPAHDDEYYASTLTGAITIPETITVGDDVIHVTEIRSSVFKDCANITSVVIEAAITEIRDNCFQNCTGLTSINIPASCALLRHSRHSDRKNCQSVFHQRFLEALLPLLTGFSQECW